MKGRDKTMKKFAVVLSVFMVLSFANFAFASATVEDSDGSAAVHVENPITNNNTNTNTATGTGTGGNVDANIVYKNPRNFLGALGGYQVDLIDAGDTSKYHRTVQTDVIEYGVITQASYDQNINFLNDFRALDSNTRTWPDLRNNLVVQPMIVNRKDPLEDKFKVRIISAKLIEKFDITDENYIGYVIVKERAPSEDPVDSMYYGLTIYPCAKKAGARVLIPVDSYFWGKVKSGSWGAGFGGAIAHLTSCLGGNTLGANAGYSSGSAGEAVAGGKLYLALSCSAVEECPPKKPEVECKTCDSDKIWKEIEKWERKYCPNYNLKNLRRHIKIACLDIDMFLCTGEKTFLERKYTVEETRKKYLGAIGHFERAEENMVHIMRNAGPKERAEARAEMDEAYRAWGWVILQLDGTKAAEAFERKHKVVCYKKLEL